MRQIGTTSKGELIVIISKEESEKLDNVRITDIFEESANAFLDYVADHHSRRLSNALFIALAHHVDYNHLEETANGKVTIELIKNLVNNGYYKFYGIGYKRNDEIRELYWKYEKGVLNKS